MNKKYGISIISSRSYLISLLISLLLVIVVSISTQKVYAANAGCYVRTGSSTGAAYTEATCPNDPTITKGVEELNKCYVAPGGSSGVGSFTETDCSSFSATTTPSSQTGQSAAEDAGTVEFYTQEGKYQCGTGDNAVMTSLNFGCKGAELDAQGKFINPIVDMALAIFRVLSAGVGLVVIGSIIFAGIQYSSSRGNPQATQAAISRVTNSFLALLLYIFIFAIANYLVPGGMLI